MKIDREYLRALRNVSDEEMGVHELLHRQKSILPVDMNEAIDAHRAEIEKREGVSLVRRGGRLQLFMLYDLIVLVIVLAIFHAAVHLRVGAGVEALAWPADGSLSVDDERRRRLVWSMLYFANFVYSLAALPFALFEVPLLGPALHGAAKTGYDASGTLAPQLTSGLLKMKIAAEREQEAYQERKPKDRQKAVDVIQRHQTRRRRSLGLEDGRVRMQAAAAAETAAAAPSDEGALPFIEEDMAIGDGYAAEDGPSRNMARFWPMRQQGTPPMGKGALAPAHAPAPNVALARSTTVAAPEISAARRGLDEWGGRYLDA